MSDRTSTWDAAMAGALDANATWHMCRLKLSMRGVPKGTPCDMCIEDAKSVADRLYPPEV